MSERDTHRPHSDPSETAVEDLSAVRGDIRPPLSRRGQLPTPPDRYRYSISELEEETGLAARTIRYYITNGLLAPAYGRGPTATYDLGHLLRLRLIARLRERNVSLKHIRERLGQLSDDEIASLLGVEQSPPQDRWRRIQLHPDIELHVRDRSTMGLPNDQAFDEAIDLIISLAQPVIDRLEGDE